MLAAELKQKLLVKDDLFTDILGQNKVKHNLKSALLMSRHFIIIGPPGIGKTTLAKNIAKLLPAITVNDCGYHCTQDNPICPSCMQAKVQKHKIKTKEISGDERFIRVQGSPDLTAEDLLGDIDPVKAIKYGGLSIEAFTPGKIFKANNGILFFDELNRAPEKLQNALLQVLEEGKITIGSYDMDFHVNFIFIATMNPKDATTERLADVLLDRFDMLYMGYPETIAIEMKILELKGKKLPVVFPEQLLHYIVAFIHELRENKNLEQVPSVRATLGLYERSQSNALLKNHKEVTLEDIKEIIESVLPHRIKLRPSVKLLLEPAQFVKDEIDKFSDSKQYRESKRAMEEDLETTRDGST
ncbi:ATP-binding protein [Candidatus Woesearchaeota archaeon]|nr:ATP-binding protein [Candidatus Woesearchaeota archaeon]